MLARAYRDVGQVDRAVTLFEETLQRQREVEGPRNTPTLYSLHHLAVAHARAGHLEQAAELLKETIATRRDVLGPEHPDTLDSMLELATIHLQRNAFTEAEPLILATYQACAHRHETENMPRDRRQLEAAITQLIRLYENTNRPDQASVSRKELDALKAAESK